LLEACRALRNDPGGVQTNRDQALQVEIICYSNKPLADQRDYRLWVGDMPDTAYDDLAEFILWTQSEFGVQLYWPERAATSYAGANAPGFRLSQSEWDNWGGICGHQHVPEGNTHWDPGAFDWNKLFTKLTLTPEEPMPAPIDPPLKDYEQAAIDRLLEAGVFTEYTVDNNPEGELNAPVPLRTLAVFLDRLMTSVESVQPAPGECDVTITVNGEQVHP
jgi:hypothetical protein